MLPPLFFLFLSLPIVQTKFNLYYTEPTLDIDHHQVNCLHYHHAFETNGIEKTEYCLGPTEKNSFDDVDLLHISRKFTFDQLRELNVDTTQLLSWSATIDLAEQYQYYLQHHQNEPLLSEEMFINCTNPWFGPQCQYSFYMDRIESFEKMIRKMFRQRFVSKPLPGVNNLTCYIHIKCDRGGSGLCLDWREVCDGRIDCLNGGVDEAECFQLESNQCNENEYQCHDGLCISKLLLGDHAPHCLDQSDLSDETFHLDTEYPYIINYEDVACRPGYAQFSCGDGLCVTDYNECRSNRHLLLIDSITGQGYLSNLCWMMMICLTKIPHSNNEISCEQLLAWSNITATLQTCGELIQFPTVPVLFGHIRFLYRLNNHLNPDTNLSLVPDYICYDQELCDFLTPTFFFEGFSCRKSDEFTIDWTVKPNSWVFLIHLVDGYFRKCSTRYTIDRTKSQSPSLYCCRNSSKCISRHRILDNISDCYLNDDEEEYALSCSIGDPLRFKCLGHSKCYSFIVPKRICSVSFLRNLEDIEFKDICDRHTEMYPLTIDGQNHTDETDCDQWPCSNYYTRCDGFWSCSDGKDEENCTVQICPPNSYPCVSRNSVSVTCLPANQVNDGHIDCFGSLDELQHCRSAYRSLYFYEEFRCLDSDVCIGAQFLCNGQKDCPLGDDEAFCADRTAVENIFYIVKHATQILFTLIGSPIYPALRNQTTAPRPNKQRIETRKIEKLVTVESPQSTWLWHCNPGIPVRHWLGGENISEKCFCPPSHYGDRCQYQNQRVTFTAKLNALSRTSVYVVIVRLVEENKEYQQINSYHQFTLVFSLAAACYRTINGYLTYTRRVNNPSMSYNVRVDVYNKMNLTYLATWLFPVPFSFLPVNRIVVALDLPLQSTPTVSPCPVLCGHGECTRYMKRENYFCRCHSGWSGVRCDVEIRCSACSNDSLCIGMISNRPICVCPLHKGGLRCLLTFPPQEDVCQNNGQWLTIDDGMYELSFLCICPDNTFGSICKQEDFRLTITVDKIQFSSVLLIYIIDHTFENGILELGAQKTAQKLTMFQRTISISLHFAYQMVFVRSDHHNYYLAVLQHEDHVNISTSIDASRRCPLINELVTPHSLAWPLIRRIKSYHSICQTHLHLICFFDEPYMCLCTLEHHANCFRLQSTPPKCPDNSYCQHGGQCLMNHPECPTKIMCYCTDCFFGDRCQFQAKGIGLTLDDILRYEIRPHTPMHDQSNTLKWTCALTMIIFVAGLINSILSIITFRSKKLREVGCGIYLLASSITSLLTVSVFTLKFWFLFLTYTNLSIDRSFHRGGCVSLEFILKVCLYVDSWFNAAVALDRAMTVRAGVRFNKALSKRIARWMLIILPLLVIVSLIHESLYRDLVDDSEEERVWCVLEHSSTIETYNRIILLFHSIGPFCVNLFSALSIIFRGARRGTTVQKRKTYQEHLQQQFQEHKSLIISPIVLVILTVPRVWIAFLSGCVKVSHNTSLYLSGYLVSFIPSMSIFFVFVCPSSFYRKQFKKSFKCCR